MAFGWFRKKENQSALDYSEIDSNEKAIDLFEKEKLAKLYLMPLEFGGQDHAMNILYVPEFAVLFKARFDGMIENLLQQRKKLSYSASPEYKGKSFIPSKLNITVKGDIQFSETI